MAANGVIVQVLGQLAGGTWDDLHLLQLSNGIDRETL
jgi:hypothetical protein